MDNKQIPKGFLAWFKHSFADSDKIDVFSEYDKTLNFKENQNIFMDKFADLFIEGKERNLKLKELAEEKKKLDFNERKEQFERDFGIEINFVR